MTKKGSFLLKNYAIMLRKSCFSIASVLLTLIFTPICLSNHKAWAEEIKVTPVTPKKETTLTMFENISLAPRFTPMLKVLHGISGGTVETQKMSGRVAGKKFWGYGDADPRSWRKLV
jgi:hypothetical protein